MRFVYNAAILAAAVVIGGGRVQAQDPWDPQGSQGTQLQGIAGYDSLYILSTRDKPISAPLGVLSVAPGPNSVFTATAVTGSSRTNVNVTIVRQQQRHNSSGGRISPTRFEYEVVYHGGKPLCGKENNWALAIPGRYSAMPIPSSARPGPLYHPEPDKVSFACVPRAVGTWRALNV